LRDEFYEAYDKVCKAEVALEKSTIGEDSHQKGMALLKAVDHLMRVSLKYEVACNSRFMVHLLYLMTIVGSNVRLGCREDDVKQIVDTWQHYYKKGKKDSKEGSR
jgi:hypothetical protein